MTELTPSEILWAVLALIGFGGVILLAVLHRRDDRQTSERLIDALKEIRNDTAMLDKIEGLAVKVVPVDLTNNVINLVASLINTPDASKIADLLKDLLKQVTDGQPNTKPPDLHSSQTPLPFGP